MKLTCALKYLLARHSGLFHQMSLGIMFEKKSGFERMAVAHNHRRKTPTSFPLSFQSYDDFLDDESDSGHRCRHIKFFYHSCKSELLLFPLRTVSSLHGQ